MHLGEGHTNETEAETGWCNRGTPRPPAATGSMGERLYHRLQEEPTWPTPGLWASGPRNRAAEHFCCFSHTARSALLLQSRGLTQQSNEIFKIISPENDCETHFSHQRFTHMERAAVQE